MLFQWILHVALPRMLAPGNNCPYLTVLTSSPQLLLKLESGDGAFAYSQKESELTVLCLAFHLSFLFHIVPPCSIQEFYLTGQALDFEQYDNFLVHFILACKQQHNELIPKEILR